MRLTLSGRIAANSIVQIAGNGLAMLITLFTFAAIVRALGPSSFGDFAAATAFIAIPVLLGTVGLGWTVLREISQHPDRSARVVGTSVVISCLAAVPILAGGVALAFLLPFNAQVQYAVAVGALSGFFTVADTSLMPAVQAKLRMEWVMVTLVFSRLLRLGLVLGLIQAGYGFEAIVWAYVAGDAAKLLLDAIVVRRIAGVRLNFDLRYGWILLRGSMVLGIAMIISSAYWYVDRVLLSLLRPSAEVGLYATAFKFVELSFVVVSAIALSVFPVLTRAIADGSHERVAYLLQWSLEIMLLVSVPACVFSLVYAEQLIELVAGPQYTEAAAAMQILGLLVVVIFISAPLERALIAGHRERLLGVLSAVALAVNVALSLVFIPIYGYMGLAVVSLVTVVVWLMSAAYFTRRLFEFTPRLRFAALVIAAGALMAGILALVPTSPVLAGAVALGVYAVTVALPPEGTGRELVRRILADARRRRVASTESHPVGAP